MESALFFRKCPNQDDYFKLANNYPNLGSNLNFEIELTVVLSEEEYKELLRDSKILEVLRERGVDNWDGYEDAIKENEEYINDCDDILDEMPIRIGYDINIDWIKNIEECRLKNEIVVVTKAK